MARVVLGIVVCAQDHDAVCNHLRLLSQSARFSGLVWDRSAAKAVEWSASLVSERAMLSQIDAYVGGDGGWASGEVDPDEDDYPSSGGSNGDDFGVDDYW